MKVELTTITAEYAKSLLENKNINNRRMRTPHVEFLAKEIAEGRWQCTGDTIKFATSGRLLDGQHRLAAIAASGLTVSCWVASDCDEAIFEVLDMGKQRTVGDLTAAAGYEFPQEQAAIARVLMQYEAQDWVGWRRPSNSQVLDYLRNKSLRDYAHKAHGYYANGHKLLAKSISGALLVIIAEHGSDHEGVFCDRLIRGVGLAERSSVLLLRQKLEQHRAGRYNFGTQELLGLCLKAYVMYLNDEECTRLNYNPRNEPFPVLP